MAFLSSFVGWVQPTTRSITHTDVNRYPVDSPLRYYPDDKLRATLRTRSNFTLTKVRYGQRLPRLDFIKARNGYKISSIGREQPTTLLFSMPTKIGIQEPSGFRVVARNGNYFVGCNNEILTSLLVESFPMKLSASRNQACSAFSKSAFSGIFSAIVALFSMFFSYFGPQAASRGNHCGLVSCPLLSHFCKGGIEG